MDNLQELAEFLSAQRFLGIAHKFYNNKQVCLEIFAASREYLQDIKPLLKDFTVIEKIKNFTDKSEIITIAVMKN